jgi:hypothetical protein
MKTTNILTLLVCAGLGLSMVAPIAKADSVPATATSKIEATKAAREAALEKRTAERKAKLEENTTKKEAKIDQYEAKKTAKIEQKAANKEATVQAHKDATAAKQEILKNNREAIKASKTKTTAQ